MLRLVSIIFILMMQLFVVSCNSEWSNQTVQSTVDIPEFRLNKVNIEIQENLDPGSIIERVQINDQKCSRFNFNLANTFGGFFQINEQGAVSLVSAYPRPGNYPLEIIAECDFVRFNLFVNIIVEENNELEVDFISDYPQRISSSNSENYIVSGTCSEVGGTIQVRIGSIFVNTQCLGRNWSVSRDVSNLPDGNVSVDVIHTSSDLRQVITISENVLKDTLSLAPIVMTPVDNQKINTTVFTVTGQCEANNSIVLAGDLLNTVQSTCPGNGMYEAVINFSDGDGEKVIQISQTDLFGNTSTTSNRTVSVDRVKPIPVIDLLDPNDSGPVFTLKISFIDENSIVQNTLDVADFETAHLEFLTPITYSVQDQSFIFDVQALESATSLNNGQFSIKFLSDKASDDHLNPNVESQELIIKPAPSVQLISGINTNYTNLRTINFDLLFSEPMTNTVELSDFEFVNIVPDGNLNQISSSHYIFTASVPVNLNETTISVRYLANQATSIVTGLGNIESEQFSAIFDDRVPLATIFPFPLDQVIDEQVQYEIIISEPVNDIIEISDFTINGGTISDVAIDPQNPLRYTFNVNAVDPLTSSNIGFFLNTGTVFDLALNSNIQSDTVNVNYKVPMSTTWSIASGEELDLPLFGGYDVVIDWGDGSPVSIVDSSGSSPDEKKHTYNQTGVFEVKISGSIDRWSITGVALNHQVLRDSLVRVDNLGDMNWLDLSNGFNGCNNLNFFYAKYVSSIEDMNHMFFAASSLSINTLGWDFGGLNAIGTLTNIFTGSNLSDNDYGVFIDQLQSTTSQPSGHNVGIIPARYPASVLSEYNNLLSIGWIFDDQGQAP